MLDPMENYAAKDYMIFIMLKTGYVLMMEWKLETPVEQLLNLFMNFVTTYNFRTGYYIKDRKYLYIRRTSICRTLANMFNLATDITKKVGFAHLTLMRMHYDRNGRYVVFLMYN